MLLFLCLSEAISHDGGIWPTMFTCFVKAETSITATSWRRETATKTKKGSSFEWVGTTFREEQQQRFLHPSFSRPTLVSSSSSDYDDDDDDDDSVVIRKAIVATNKIFRRSPFFVEGIQSRPPYTQQRTTVMTAASAVEDVIKLYDVRGGGGSENGYHCSSRGGSGYYNNNYRDGYTSDYDYRQEQYTTASKRRANQGGGGGYGESDDDREGMYYDDDDYYYGDQKQPSGGRRAGNAAGAAAFDAAASAANIVSSLPNIIRNGDRKVGIALLGSGAMITFLGMSLFFNKTLMRFGNLLVISGVPILLGPSRTIGYFVQPQKARATACLVFGIFLVLIGSPVLGIVFEIFGILNLFGNMFPVVWAIVKQMPVIGPILKGTAGSSNNGGNNRQRSRYSYDDYGGYGYDDQQDNFDEYNRRSRDGRYEQRYDSYDDGYSSYNSNPRDGY